MARPFRISVGPSRLQTRVERKKWHWETLVKRLQTFEQLDITYEDYLALPKDQQSQLKDVGYYIGGQFNSSGRLLENMVRRCCLTLDIDHIDWLDIDEIQETYAGLEFVVHSTLKHSDDSPRLRLVFPLTTDIHPDKYEPVARKVADQLGMDCFDDTTFQPARIMFWPAVTCDGDIFPLHNEGKFINPDEILAEYDDWKDFGEWPHSSRTSASRGPVRMAEDPLTKAGIIGAFNRTHDIHSAIATFELPYDSTDFDNRYSPHGSSGAAGAIVYDDVFLYSNHESDVVGLQNVNAWDLVRMHRFGDLDAGIDKEKVKMMQLPSSKEMKALAMNDTAVFKELADDELRKVNGEDRSPDRLGEPTGEAGSGESTLTYDSIAESIEGLVKDDKPATEQILNRMAAAESGLDPMEVDMLAGQLKARTGLGKGVIDNSIKARAKLGAGSQDSAPKDLQRELIKLALDEHYHGGRTLKYVGRRCWRYQKGKWSLIDDHIVRGRVGQTITRLKETRPDDVLALVDAVEDKQTSSVIKDLTQMMLDALSVGDDTDDPLRLMRMFPLPIINCMNTELQFDAKGVINERGHKPEHFHTLRVDTEYDPKAKCPEWDRFMEMVFSDADDPEQMIRHFHEICGYVVNMSRWLKTWFMFHGPKDTGKSTAGAILADMLGTAFFGKEIASAANDTYAFKEQAIIGKLVMLDDDFKASGTLPDDFMKKYSEEKATTASLKFGAEVNFRARALPMILSNHWPQTKDTTPAFAERGIIVPFTYRIKGADQDDQRRAAMFNEKPGILNHFVAGLQRLRQRGNWDVPLTCHEATKIWIGRSNPFQGFFAQCVQMGGGPANRINRELLFTVYLEWYGQQTGHIASKRGSNPTVHKDTFYEKLTENFGKYSKSGKDRYYPNMRFNNNAPLREYEMPILDGWDDMEED